MKNLKKLLALFLALVLCFSLFACTSGHDSNGDDETDGGKGDENGEPVDTTDATALINAITNAFSDCNSFSCTFEIETVQELENADELPEDIAAEFMNQRSSVTMNMTFTLKDGVPTAAYYTADINMSAEMGSESAAESECLEMFIIGDKQYNYNENLQAWCVSPVQINAFWEIGESGESYTWDIETFIDTVLPELTAKLPKLSDDDIAAIKSVALESLAKLISVDGESYKINVDMTEDTSDIFEYLGSLKPTDKVTKLLNDLLAKIAPSLTTNSILDTLASTGSYTVASAYSLIENLFEAQGLTLQGAYDAIMQAEGVDALISALITEITGACDEQAVNAIKNLDIENAIAPYFAYQVDDFINIIMREITDTSINYTMGMLVETVRAQLNGMTLADLGVDFSAFSGVKIYKNAFDSLFDFNGTALQGIYAEYTIDGSLTLTDERLIGYDESNMPVYDEISATVRATDSLRVSITEVSPEPLDIKLPDGATVIVDIYETEFDVVGAEGYTAYITEDYDYENGEFIGYLVEIYYDSAAHFDGELVATYRLGGVIAEGESSVSAISDDGSEEITLTFDLKNRTVSIS